MAIIEIEQLSKVYGKQQVLFDLDLRLEANRLIGFLGPNGAGKTTTIRIMVGLLAASSGAVRVLGRDSARHGNTIRKQVGYLPGDIHFYPGLTGRNTLRFLAQARGQNCHQEMERLAQQFDLELDRRVRKYSTGMRQKLGLIQSMMHQPKLLILDEPTSALDPLVRESVFAELKSFVNRGGSVLFSSHSLNEVEALCDEVVILRDGRIAEQQKIETLRQKALKKVVLQFASADRVPENWPSDFQNLQIAGGRVQATWSGSPTSLLCLLNEFELVDLTIEQPDLNDLFMTYYRDIPG